jgi:hypothetical protein
MTSDRHDDRGERGERETAAHVAFGVSLVLVCLRRLLLAPVRNRVDVKPQLHKGKS